MKLRSWCLNCRRLSTGQQCSTRCGCALESARRTHRPLGHSGARHRPRRSRWRARSATRERTSPDSPGRCRRRSDDDLTTRARKIIAGGADDRLPIPAHATMGHARCSVCSPSRRRLRSLRAWPWPPAVGGHQCTKWPCSRSATNSPAVRVPERSRIVVRPSCSAVCSGLASAGIGLPIQGLVDRHAWIDGWECRCARV
jgi:hypothetical protein